MRRGIAGQTKCEFPDPRPPRRPGTRAQRPGTRPVTLDALGPRPPDAPPARRFGRRATGGSYATECRPLNDPGLGDPLPGWCDAERQAIRPLQEDA